MSKLADQISSLSPGRRALLESKLAKKDAASAPEPVRRQPSDPRVLSCAQHQMWFLDQLAPGSSAYSVPYAVRMRGHLNGEALGKAVSCIVGRHEVLRTMYLPYQGKVIPAVAKQWSSDLQHVDLRDQPAVAVRAILEEEGSRAFDLARDIKLRTTLYRLSDDEFIFLHVSHHIAWDLHSRVIFYRELEEAYAAFVDGTPITLPELSLQYGDYALWQYRLLQGPTLESLESYWKQQLAGAPQALTLPTDFPRPAVQSLNGVRLPLQLSPAVLESARATARDSKVTLYMTLLSAFLVFLYCYADQQDICVGSPFDERRSSGLQSMIGMFINTLVLRARVDGASGFRGLMHSVRDVVLGAIDHQVLPFEKLVEAVNPPRDPSRMTLFQANFRLQGEAPPPLRLKDMDVDSCTLVDNGTAKFDLALELPSVSESRGYLEYNTGLFTPATARRMAGDFQALLSGLIAQPDMAIDLVPDVIAITSRLRGR